MSQSVARRCGVSYRQLDHWTRMGYLHPVQVNKAGSEVSGSGHIRDWPTRELAVAADMGRLIKAGLTPKAAHRVAREHRAETVLRVLTGGEAA